MEQVSPIRYKPGPQPLSGTRADPTVRLHVTMPASFAEQIERVGGNRPRAVKVREALEMWLAAQKNGDG